MLAHLDTDDHQISAAATPMLALLNTAQMLSELLGLIDSPEILSVIEVNRTALLAEAAGFNDALAAKIRAATPAAPRTFGHGLGLFTPRDPRLSAATTDQIIGEIVRRGACRAVLADLISRGHVHGVRIEP